jgi:probable H4MPT-linked C1 transfer pathway protein
MKWLGLDIGGANLKAADGQGWARSLPFALWRDPDRLAGALRELVEPVTTFERVGVTMTGELCDCFRTKAEGVRHILDAVDEAIPGERDVDVYFVDGRLVPLEKAREEPELAAASNWHALARFSCRYVGGRPAMLIDIGSTTTDIVPLANGQVDSTSLIDTERLIRGELVYTGVGRTPVCAVVDSLPWGGSACPVAAEVFATTADVYLLLTEIKRQPEATWTADGRPLTPEFSIERMARMVCADRTQFGTRNAVEAAAAVRDAQLVQLRAALEKVTSQQPRPPECFVISGAGEFLARMLVEQCYPSATVISLTERLGPEVSECAPAHAVAVLAGEYTDDREVMHSA